MAHNRYDSYEDDSFRPIGLFIIRLGIYKRKTIII